MTSPRKVKHLILGGGLSGISAAYFLSERGEDDFLILEKDATPGGYCRTIPNPDYVWDYAGHFYHFATDKYRQLFESLVEPSEIIRQQKNTKIYYHDRLIDYPFQMNIHQLEQSEFIDCLYDLCKKDAITPTNFLEMLYSKFGKSITEKFLKPYNEKLYAVDLRQLDQDAMGRFFPYADLEKIILNMKEKENHSYNDSFLYLKQGTGYFIDRLADQVASHLHLNEAVTSIDPENHTVTTPKGTYIYENLISSAPLNQFLSLLGHNSLDLSYNKVLVFNLGFDKPSESYHSEHWIYFPEPLTNFYRVGFYNHILGQDKLSLYVELGFPKDATIDTNQELETTLRDLQKVHITTPSHNLVAHSTLIMDPAYVHISTSENATVQKLLDQFEQQHIYTLGRYGRWTYNSMEDCMSLADNLVEKISHA